ncbi:MAG: hypothetical protein IJV01_02480 [Bacteroidales bacterium]|nr:hypothetical protein [Bacteroidales bacterium]
MKKVILSLLCVLALTSGASAKKYVTYEKYGAVGNGVANDFPAMKAAHEAANERGLPVRAKKGAKYYIAPESGTITVQTDVDFGDAEIIIDDRNCPKGKYPVFVVSSTLKPVKLKGVTPPKKDQPNLGVTLERRSLVVIVDDNHKVYIRKGGNANNGTGLKEVLVVEKDGSIDPKTAVMWDYDNLTSAIAYPIDDQTLTIRGGRFKTIANNKAERNYYHRGIQVKRSNVKVEGLRHTVEGEGDEGAPYSGILTLSTCCEVEVSDCIFTGHRIYQKMGALGKPVSRGSYDYGMNTVANVTLRKCRQFDDIDDAKHWGIMGTNFCKNLTMEDCSVSRFDAHMGVENVTLRRCTFGHMGVRMVGRGTIRLEDCELRYNTVIALRTDYGSSWDGDIIVRNCVLRPVKKGLKELTILNGNNSGTHDFGYECRLPRRIDVDGLLIDDSVLDPKAQINVYASFGRDVSKPDLLPYNTDAVVTLKNVTVKSGRPIGLSSNPGLFPNVKIVRE